MRTLLKILLGSLLLVLLVALGTEVVALHRSAHPRPNQAASPMVVRKSPTAPTPPKTVRPLTAYKRPPAAPAPHNAPAK